MRKISIAETALRAMLFYENCVKYDAMKFENDELKQNELENISIIDKFFCNF